MEISLSLHALHMPVLAFISPVIDGAVSRSSDGVFLLFFVMFVLTSDMSCRSWKRLLS